MQVRRMQVPLVVSIKGLRSCPTTVKSTIYSERTTRLCLFVCLLYTRKSYFSLVTEYRAVTPSEQDLTAKSYL